MEEHGKILVFAAHSDDQVIGAGGTISKYTELGHDVIVVVFSFGELTHPWLKREHLAKMRVVESQKAAKVLGCKKTLFLGMLEGKFLEDEPKIKKTIEHILHENKPSRIFVHSPEDIHPDHKAVHKLVLECSKDVPIYGYEIWNPLQKGDRLKPELYVDISKHFSIKLKALSCFKSQKVAISVLLLGIYLRAIIAGIHHGCLFAERFTKIK